MAINRHVIAAITVGLLTVTGAVPALVDLPSWATIAIVGSLGLIAAGMLTRVTIEAFSD